VLIEKMFDAKHNISCSMLELNRKYQLLTTLGSTLKYLAAVCVADSGCLSRIRIRNSLHAGSFKTRVAQNKTYR
jgi:hypothetical protein